MMRLKISPALVMVVFGVLMWFLHQYVHPELLVFSVPEWTYKVFFSLAVICGVLGIIQFGRHKTTVDPHRVEKASTLVSSGIYSYSRNPMYLAMLIGLIGFGVKLGSLLSLFVIPFFVMYMNRFQIIPEEEMLSEKFGQEFEAYKSKVRRWL